MMFIKRGAQYSVLPAFGRVYKVPNTERQALNLWASWAPDEDKSSLRLRALQIIEEGRQATEAMERLCVAYPAVRAYLGSPTFYKGGMYSQQKVQTLDSVFARQTHEENVRLLEEYACALLKEWEYGFAEGVFNLTLNNGLNTKGQLVLIDFGEVIFDQAEVKKCIAEKRWLNSWSYKSGMPKDLQPAYERILSRTLTLANLKRHWGIAR